MTEIGNNKVPATKIEHRWGTLPANAVKSFGLVNQCWGRLAVSKMKKAAVISSGVRNNKSGTKSPDDKIDFISTRVSGEENLRASRYFFG